jgi:hypothetical protein
LARAEEAITWASTKGMALTTPGTSSSASTVAVEVGNRSPSAE